MATRRDLFQSYQFMVQRVVSALVLRETDPAQTPLRRMGGATFAGIMITVIALAIAGVIGVISPGGNTTWQSGGKVIIEEETGAPFVWVKDDTGKFHLHPTTNFSSAVLIAGTDTTVSVSRNSLRDAPRGARLGLGDAPSSLPDSKYLLGAPWTLCSLPATTASGDEVPNTALVIGQNLSSGVPVASRAILARDTETGTLHLVWNGRQYPVTDEDAVLEGLALRSVPQIRVGTAWLSALPAGQDLGPLSLTGRGKASTALPGGVIGQVRYVQSGDKQQFYVVSKDSIVAITEVQSQILLAAKATQDLAYAGKAPAATPLAAAEAASAKRVELTALQPASPPATPTEMATVGSARSTVCASFNSASPVPQVAVEASIEGAELAVATPSRTEGGTVLANQVQIKGGYGAIVESMMSPTATTGSLFLVTDEGKRFSIPTRKILAVLGYGSVTPVQLPASLVARIPTGDVLDPDGARQRG